MVLKRMMLSRWTSFLLLVFFSALSIVLVINLSYAPLRCSTACSAPPERIPQLFLYANASTLPNTTTPKQLPWSEWLHPEQPCHKRTITVIWIIKQMWGSALWSGFDIANALNERYEDLVVVPMLWSDFNQLTDKQLYARLYKEGLPASEAPHLDLCLFLKFAETPMMNRCQQMKASTAILWVDGHPHLTGPVSERDPMLRLKDKFTYHILPNTLTSQHYPFALDGKRTWVIPQHDSRPEGIPDHDPRKPVREIAWQGGKHNRMSTHVKDAITGWAEKRGLTFREYHYKGVEAKLSGLIEERRRSFMEIATNVDIMVIFPAESDSFSKLVYKPNGRNIFAMSMGIPTVLFPYVSYTEALKWSPYPAFASNVPELLRWLDILVNRTEAREELSRLGLEFAKQLSIQRVGSMWAWHLRSEFCRSRAQKI